MTQDKEHTTTLVDAIESLENQLKQATSNERVDTLFDLSAKLSASDAPRARLLAEEALGLAQRIGYKLGQAKATQALAYSTWCCGELEAALALADQSRELFELQGDRTGAARSCLIRSMVFRHKSRFEEATRALIDAHRLSEECGDQQGAAMALDGLGGLCFQQGDLSRALVYRERCKRIHETLGDRYRLAMSLINIGEIQAKKGATEDARKNFKQAVASLLEIEPEGYPLAAAYQALGELSLSCDEKESALAWFEKAITIRRAAGDAQGTVTSCICLGELKLGTMALDAAQSLFEEALPSAQEVGLPREERRICRGLSRIHEQRGDWKAALHWEKRASNLNDRILNEEQVRAIAEMQTKYDAERKEREAQIHELEFVQLKQEVARREKAEKALVQAQKVESLGLLAGGIAHGFNNLLMTVMGNLELASDIAPQGGEIHQYLDPAQAAGQEAAKLSRLMLVYSGQDSYQLKLCDLGPVIERARPLLRCLVPKGMQVNLAPGSTLELRSDEAQIHQLLTVLALNAAEAQATVLGIETGQRSLSRDDARYGEFTGDSLPAGKYVVLTVQDNGAGIQACDLPKIFDPFYSTKPGGKGLGLAAVLGIVRGHGGGIIVTSTPGQGSRFEFLFPASG